VRQGLPVLLRLHDRARQALYLNHIPASGVVNQANLTATPSYSQNHSGSDSESSSRFSKTSFPVSNNFASLLIHSAGNVHSSSPSEGFTNISSSAERSPDSLDHGNATSFQAAHQGDQTQQFGVSNSQLEPPQMVVYDASATLSSTPYQAPTNEHMGDINAMPLHSDDDNRNIPLNRPVLDFFSTSFEPFPDLSTSAMPSAHSHSQTGAPADFGFDAFQETQQQFDVANFTFDSAMSEAWQSIVGDFGFDNSNLMEDFVLNR